MSGLKDVRRILEGIDDIAFCDFTGKDVVRHSLVAAIVAAYDEAGEKGVSPHGHPDQLRLPQGRPRTAAAARSSTRFVLAREDKPFNTEVSVSFVTDEAIAQLNEKYRHKEGPTDVLSFECDGVDDDLSAMTLAEDPVYELGDVVIAPDVATRQTREFGTTFEEEISLLLVHGLLHLCGYDHIEDDEAEVMEKREAEILEAWAKRDVKAAEA